MVLPFIFWQQQPCHEPAMIKICLAAYHGFDEHEYARWLYGVMGDMPHRFSVEKGALVFMNRNRAFLKDGIDGYDYFLSVDTDIRFTADHVKRLIDDDLDIVSGAYVFRGQPGYYCANWQRDGVPGLVPTHEQGIAQVNTSGAGFLLMRQSVVSALGPLLFRHEFVTDENGNEDQTGEDSGFSIHAMRHGYKQFIDCDCVVEHLI